MLKRTLILLVLGLIQAGCDYGEDIWPFERVRLDGSNSHRLEQKKRELLQIEEIKIWRLGRAGNDKNRYYRICNRSTRILCRTNF